MSAKSTVTRLKHVTIGRVGNSAISTQDASKEEPELRKTMQHRWKMCAVPLRNATISPSNMPGTRSEPRNRRVVVCGLDK